jgi:membrane-bound lytic murein transglycosylase D
MARYLFWRKKLKLPVFLLLFIIFIIFYSHLIAEEYHQIPDWIKRKEEIGSLYQKALPPKQGHWGPAVYSFTFPEDETYKEYLSLLFRVGLSDLEKNLERALNYRSIIFNYIQEYDLPPELMFLPVIESAYRIDAESGAGAAGLWQMMVHSVSPSELRINTWLDERKDFWKATEIALKTLKNNYDVLGDWFLALAAYNYGLYGIIRIVKETGINDFWELKRLKLLPEETSNFVPRFLAVVQVCSYPGRYGLDSSWEESPDWDKIKLEKTVDLEVLSCLTGVPIDKLCFWNSELNQLTTPPEGMDYWLKFPSDYKLIISSALNNPYIDLVKFYFHTIYTGDTLYSLSQTYNIDIEYIMKFNPGIDAENLRIGTKIKIPVVDNFVMPKEERLLSFLSNKSFNNTYTVVKGDTLWRIAKKILFKLNNKPERHRKKMINKHLFNFFNFFNYPVPLLYYSVMCKS